PIATWRRRRFTLTSQIARKGARDRRSWIRAYGLFITEILEGDTIGPSFWLCQRCDETHNVQLFKATSTTSATSHLRK
ncbi:hypothetical protein EV126DRAFT_302715, partial [Verticillium dahliae]